MPEHRRVYWDACVILSYFNEMTGRVKLIDGLLAKSRKGEIEIFTSALSIVEVAFAAREQTTRSIDERVEQHLDEFWADRGAIQLIEPHELIQREARLLMRQGLPKGWSLGPFDAIHLASARALGVSEFHTYDKGFNKFKPDMPFDICEPYEPQTELDLDE